jgi:lysozyme
MTPESRQKLKNLLVQHESYKQFPYIDTTGHLTIGIGRNLKDRGISLNEALYLLDEDAQYFTSKLSGTLQFWDGLNEARQIALVDMCFNMGLQGLLGFKEMMLAIEAQDFDRAAQEMLDSKWATQVGERATSLARIMKSGEL